jgi:hypothetical protein
VGAAAARDEKSFGDSRFSQWAGLQEDDRAAYISDLLDTLAMAATEPAQRTAQHYSQCITRSRLGDAPDFVEVGEAGIAVGDAMRRERRVQLVG